MAERNWPEDTLNVRCDEAVRDLQRPWNTRERFDRRVLGAIELAWARGAQHEFPWPLAQEFEEIAVALERRGQQDCAARIRSLIRSEIVYDSSERGYRLEARP